MLDERTVAVLVGYIAVHAENDLVSVNATTVTQICNELILLKNKFARLSRLMEEWKMTDPNGVDGWISKWDCAINIKGVISDRTS